MIESLFSMNLKIVEFKIDKADRMVMNNGHICHILRALFS